MNCLSLIVGCLLLVAAHAQFENGFVKILEDQRYQDGANFGNFRNQEDGIKYKEETNAHGVRTGFWEYPDDKGKLVRVEFEAGPGIGFRIINSNVVDPTPKHVPQTVQAEPQRAQPRVEQRAQSQQVHRTQQPVLQLPQQIVQQPQVIPIPLVRQPSNLVIEPSKPQPVNLFDYPADLQFFRDAGGHRFKFTAV